jgi:dihydrofolate reductase
MADGAARSRHTAAAEDKSIFIDLSGSLERLKSLVLLIGYWTDRSERIALWLKKPHFRQDPHWNLHSQLGNLRNACRNAVTDISLILATATNGVIGNRGAIPWRLPEDMRRFKSLTVGKPCIMGRKTWESLPKRPLPDRTNIIVTHNRAYRADGAIVAGTLDEAFVCAQAQNGEEIMIVGGADIYRACLPRATRIHLTEIHANVEGDTAFAFDRTGWTETSRENRRTENGLAYSFVTLERY